MSIDWGKARREHDQEKTVDRLRDGFAKEFEQEWPEPTEAERAAYDRKHRGCEHPAVRAKRLDSMVTKVPPHPSARGGKS